MTLAQFEEELRRVSRFASADSIVDPLADAVLQITANPALSESRILTRVLHALIEHGGQFRRAEVSAFGPATLKLVIALFNAAQAGTNTPAQWLGAVSAADAAGA